MHGSSNDKSNGPMIDDVSCLVIITAKDDNNIAAVQFKIKPLNFYCWSTQLTDLIYTDL